MNIEKHLTFKDLGIEEKKIEAPVEEPVIEKKQYDRKKKNNSLKPDLEEINEDNYLDYLASEKQFEEE